MGGIAPTLAPSCICSKQGDDELDILKKDCIIIKERLDKLELVSQSKYNLTNQKIDSLEAKIDNKMDLMNEKCTRIEDKIDNKFDLILLTIQNNRNSN